jgi:hypothetical protein
MPERIHFVRQSVHTMTHLAPETIRVGPAALYSQWTMERTIGNLGQEIKSDSQPYANLSERGLRRSHRAVQLISAMRLCFCEPEMNINTILKELQAITYGLSSKSEMVQLPVSWELCDGLVFGFPMARLRARRGRNCGNL